MPTVVILGGGVGGILSAIRIKKLGLDYVIFEKSDEVGGVWNLNTYPGCGCDVPSHMYSISSDLNPDWTQYYSLQGEIRRYLIGVANKYGVRERTRFRTEVVKLAWQEETNDWCVWTRRVGSNEISTATAQFVISAVGGLHVPSYPTSIRGFGSFGGPAFHSTLWNHDVDYSGKRVAVIGSAASAVQIIPEIAKKAAKVVVYQRTANWVMPRKQFRYPELVKWAFRNVPGLLRFYRMFMFAVLDARVIIFRKNSVFNTIAARLGKRWLAHEVKDSELRQKLMPTISPGCKRILMSDDFYSTLTQPHVEVINAPIREITTNGIVAEGVGLREVDIVVYATGFKPEEAFSSFKVHGRDGVVYPDAWAGSMPEGYLGTLMTGLPNLFTIAGPNTGTGHMSVIHFMESQLNLIEGIIKGMRETSATAVDVYPEASRAFNEEIQARFATTVWGADSCRSWYQGKDGRLLVIWPGSATNYWWNTLEPRWQDLNLKGAKTAPGTRVWSLRMALRAIIFAICLFGMHRAQALLTRA